MPAPMMTALARSAISLIRCSHSSCLADLWSQSGVSAVAGAHDHGRLSTFPEKSSVTTSSGEHGGHPPWVRVLLDRYLLVNQAEVDALPRSDEAGKDVHDDRQYVH